MEAAVDALPFESWSRDEGGSRGTGCSTRQATRTHSLFSSHLARHAFPASTSVSQRRRWRRLEQQQGCLDKKQQRAKQKGTRSCVLIAASNPLIRTKAQTELRVKSREAKEERGSATRDAARASATVVPRSDPQSISCRPDQSSADLTHHCCAFLPRMFLLFPLWNDIDRQTSGCHID